MPLSGHLQILWRRRWLIVLLVVVGAGTALALTLTARPSYVAMTTLRVATASAVGGSSVRSDDIEYVDRLENTYVKLATSRHFIDEVAARASLDERPEIGAEGVPNTELLEIRATMGSRESAATSANAAATLLIARIRALSARPSAAESGLQKEIDRLEGEVTTKRAKYLALAGAVGTPTKLGARAKLRQAEQKIAFLQERIAELSSELDAIRAARLERGHALSVVQFASAGRARPESHVVRNLVIAGLAGLLVGVALAYAGERLRQQVYSEKELQEAAGAPVFGTVPAVSIRGGAPRFNSGSPAEKVFSRLRLTLIAATAETTSASCPLILITSPERRDGKTTVGVNLARAIASSGRRVLLVDGDVRRPSLHERLGLPSEPGFADVLKGTDAASVTHATDTPQLFAIASGKAAAEPPGELFGGTQLVEVLEQLRRAYDYVLLDSPSLLDASEALLYAPASDGVVVVIRDHAAALDAVKRSLEVLHTMNLPFVGLVVNKVGQRPHYSRAEYPWRG